MVKRRLLPIAALFTGAVFLAGCSRETAGPHSGELSEDELRSLLQALARAWEEQDTEAAVAAFTEDAVYMEPPDVQLFAGREQLRSYFGAVEPGTTMTWHHIWFDPATQVGAGEFTFGHQDRDRATHGVAVVRLREGRIAAWHEYLQAGPASREEFLAIEDKQWEWHIGNYP